LDVFIRTTLGRKEKSCPCSFDKYVDMVYITDKSCYITHCGVTEPGVCIESSVTITH